MSQPASVTSIPRKDIHAHRLLILDFGSQYTQLIARRVRETGVYCEIHPWDMSDKDLRVYHPKGVILSGGPETVTLEDTPRIPDAVFALDVPVLGICYGEQTMAQQLGGSVENVGKSEFGYARVRARGHTALLRDIQDEVNEEGHGLLDVWMSHGDRVEHLPDGFIAIGWVPLLSRYSTVMISFTIFTETTLILSPRKYDSISPLAATTR